MKTRLGHSNKMSQREIQGWSKLFLFHTHGRRVVPSSFSATQHAEILLTNGYIIEVD